MRKTIARASAAAVAVLLVIATGDRSSAQPAQPARSTIAQSLSPPAFSLARVREALIEFPLPKGAEIYGSIDGHKMHQYVVDLAQIALRYRDAGHPQFWGRLIGTASERNGSVADRQVPLVRSLGRCTFNRSSCRRNGCRSRGRAAMTSGGKTIQLTSAQPAYYANGCRRAACELEAVYAGLGTEADFMGKDVRGKAVFVYGMLGLPDEGAERAVRRADAKGAAVIFAVSMLPGNMHYEAYPSNTKAPCFYLGNDDGTAARELIESAKDGPMPKVSRDAGCHQGSESQQRVGLGDAAGCHR